MFVAQCSFSGVISALSLPRLCQGFDWFSLETFLRYYWQSCKENYSKKRKKTLYFNWGLVSIVNKYESMTAFNTKKNIQKGKKKPLLLRQNFKKIKWNEIKKKKKSHRFQHASEALAAQLTSWQSSESSQRLCSSILVQHSTTLTWLHENFSSNQDDKQFSIHYAN